MDDDDLPPGPRKPKETAAGDFGQLMGGGLWLALLLAVAGVVLYFLTRAHG
jgi:hypothetical protein